MAKKESKKVFRQPQKNLTLIYVGPGVFGGVLTRFKIYKNGIPDNVLQGVKNVSALKKLFVLPEDLGGAMLNVKAKGHPLNLCYTAIEKEFSKEDK